MRREETWRETAFYWGYRALQRLAMSLPERVGRATFEAIGAVAYRRLAGVRATVAANQARVLGLEPADERVQLSTREAFGLYARFWYDAFRVRALSRDEVNERTEVVGLENLEGALEAGHGAICALPHMGNWDIAGHYLAINGYRLASVAEDLRPARLSDLFLEHRRALGMRIIRLKDGHVGQRLKQLLAENWVVALVADRDLTGRGVEVELFGATCRMPTGPAVLSLTSGAPLLVTPTFTTPTGWRIRMAPPLTVSRTRVMRDDVAALTRAVADGFERAISAQPADWHMFQPLWDDAPAAATAAAAATA